MASPQRCGEQVCTLLRCSGRQQNTFRKFSGKDKEEVPPLAGGRSRRVSSKVAEQQLEAGLMGASLVEEEAFDLLQVRRLQVAV